MSRIVDFARQELGLTLYPKQAAMLAEFEAGGFQQAVWRCGRRGGKSLLADVLALYDVAIRDHLRSRMLPGETRTVGIVSPRLDQAQAHIRRLESLARRSTRLRRLLDGPPTADAIRFRGAEIIAYPCSARSIRGGGWSCAVLDELGHYVSTESGNAAGDVILEAVTPSLAQFGSEGWLIAISTPRWRQGAFAKLVERAESGRYPYVHSVHASTAEMNPSIDRAWLEERRREDPEAYGREYEALWIDGAGSYFASADVMAALDPERVALEPDPELFGQYRMALDPAFRGDAYGVAIGHAERAADGRVWYVIDRAEGWRRPGHRQALDDIAELAGRYRIRQIKTDQHCERPIIEGLEERGLDGEYSPWSNAGKADAFGRLRNALRERRVELPNHDGLRDELLSIESRPTRGGQTQIGAAGGAHDDIAVCVAAIVQELDTPVEEFVAPGVVVAAGGGWRWNDETGRIVRLGGH